MNIVLGCDPLLAPLTGIGKYTQSLALGLKSYSAINNCELFAHGKFFDFSLAERCNHPVVESVTRKPQSPPLIQRMRVTLGQSTVATSIYSKLLPYVERYALRNHHEHIFHSPNFVLPNFDGKKIVTIHDLSTLKFPEYHPASRVALVNKAIRLSLEHADHILTDSHFIRDELISNYNVSQHKITAIHLGVDSCFFPRSENECSDVLETYSLKYQQYFLFVSTIEPRKNVLNLLNAYEKYRNSVKNPLPLLMVGGKGWRSEREHEKINQLEQKGYVSYLGYIPESVLPILYSGAKALLFPSMYEGFGLPVAEALQSGIQVLTSKNSAMSEFSSGSAVLVEPRSVEEISRGILILHEVENFNKSINFDWSNTIDRTVEVYRNV